MKTIRTIILLFLFVMGPMIAFAADEYTGWWYDPDKSGTGVSLEVNGDTMFLAVYDYTPQHGAPVWFVAEADQSGNSFTGELIRYSGWGLENGNPNNGIKAEETGTVTVTFASQTQGTLIFSLGEGSQTWDIVPYMDDIAPGQAYSGDIDGWWVSGEHPGMGFFIQAQGDTLFAGWYHYHENGSPRWWIMGGWNDVGGFPGTASQYSSEWVEFNRGEAGQSRGNCDITIQGNSLQLTWNAKFYTLQRYTFGDGSGDNGGDPGGKDVTYPIVDTGQKYCYNNNNKINCPSESSSFYGQDAQFHGNQPSYKDNGDGTVTDTVTGLVWQKSPDTDGNGKINSSDKKTLSNARTYCNNLSLGSKNDWRLPTIKELYSLFDASGTDPRVEATDSSGLIAFIDDGYFDFAWGDTTSGERIIDAQYASNTEYVGGNNVFGVNFADGRIKGYGTDNPGREIDFFVKCVRGNEEYGENSFVSNGDGTVTDTSTGLMWMQDDNGTGLNWEETLTWVKTKNNQNYLGYNDWRLPNIKELQSIVDYTRSPGTTSSAAIDAVFDATPIINEDGDTDYAYYWSGTTHKDSNGNGSNAMYVSFGRSLGYMNNRWTDVHGAGSQRSDPKEGDPDDYPHGFGPQGDAIRMYNYVRLVRDAQ